MLFCDADVFGTLPMKTSPSGGARHELEGYVVALEVNGVPPGLYHYNAESHALELLSTDVNRAMLERLTYGISMPPASAFMCVVTAVFPRTMYKYQHPGNYRVTLLGAGHLGQTFALAATALGLGAWQTIMFRDSELERVLGIDGYTEGALYLLGAGYPVTTAEGLPTDLRHAGAKRPSDLIEEHHPPG
jgi:SagB-type dehydrogenase family enzyme